MRSRGELPIEVWALFDPGNVRSMDRECLLEEMLRATSPHDTSIAIYDARSFLAEHPEDQKVWSAMEDLIEVERQYLEL